MNAESSYYKNIRAEMAVFLPEQYTKVLEIGCGEGLFRENLSKSCEYWGIEPHETSAREALARLDRVIASDFNQAYSALPDDYFDLVICNDVIEHMLDYDDFLHKLTRKMTRKSFVVGSVPNVRNIDNLVETLVFKDWMYRDAGVLDRTHLRFFTEKSLKRIFCENGYIIDRFHGVNRINFNLTTRGTLKYLLTYILGSDTLYEQIGFRIKYNE